MGGGDEYKSKSSISAQQEPAAKAMFEIFKSGLSKGLPAYAGSSGVKAFNPQAVQQTFRSNVGQPMQNLWSDKFAGLVGPDMQNYASGRLGETMAAMSSKAGYEGERQAYTEWLRTQPTGRPMELGQALVGTPLTASYVPESRSTATAYGILSGINAASQAAITASMFKQPPDPFAWGSYGNKGYGNITSPWAYTRNM